MWTWKTESADEWSYKAGLIESTVGFRRTYLAQIFVIKGNAAFFPCVGGAIRRVVV
jgi:hypothetical protein